MQFQCTVTKDDVAQLIRHVMDHGPAFARQKRRASFGYAIVILALFILVGLIFRMWVLPVLGLLFLVPVIPLFQWQWRRASVANSLGVLNDAKGVIGDQAYEISNGSLTRQNEIGESRVAVSSLHDVCETDSHVFVYVNASQAFIIPKRDLSAAAVEALRQMKEAIGSTARTDGGDGA